ncbi:MAG: C39 family peptidase [Thermoflexales bacterium]|nr:C39 family peptidase [Thermoflexales bacterium]
MSKILNVPYKCQNDADASLKRTDCGPACIAMILGGMGQTVTTNAVVAASGQSGDNGLMQSQVVNAAKAFGLDMTWQAGYTLDDVKRFIDNGQPPIALVKYANLPDRVDIRSTGGHYVLIVGYDDATNRVFINDPDYYPGTNGGFQKAYAYDTWLSAWGGFAVNENLNFCLIVPQPIQPVKGENIVKPQPSGTETPKWVIAPAGLLFRSAANTGASSLGGLVFGQPLTAIGAESSPADGSGRTWQQVRSAAGVTGFVAASLNGERLLAPSKPADPYIVQVIEAPEIRQAGGLAVREARNVMLNPIDRAQPGERLTVYGRVEEGGTPWLWVQTPRTQYGWARELSQGQALVGKVTPDLGGSGTGATPEPKRNTPLPVAVSSDVWVTSDIGLALREQGNRSARTISGVSKGDHLVTEGPQVGPDAENIVWQQVRTDANARGWVAAIIQGEVTLTATKPAPVQIASVVPWGKCYAGLGMGNPQPLTSVELGVIRKSKVEAFKILTLPDPGENKTLIKQLRDIRADMFIVARLFFSVDFGGRAKFSPQDFVNFVSNGFEACYEAGVRYFEVHNEPNLDIEGDGWNWNGGAGFGAWLSQVLALLRQRHNDVKLGYPGLSPNDAMRAFIDGSAAAIAQCDWIAAHSYWQHPTQPPYPMNADNSGLKWRVFRTLFPDKLIMVTEFSNNRTQFNGVPTTDADKGKQYVDYYKLVRKEPNLGAAFSFALTWPGQDINREGWVFKNGETQIAGIVGAALQAGI